MPAKKGDILHVYNKAIGNNQLFHEHEDYMVFIKYLGEYLTPFNANNFEKEFTVKGRTFKGKSHMPKNYFGEINIHAFALMSDHFHLVLSQNRERAVEQFMRSLSTRYSMYFNKKHKHSGALFQGPYRASVVPESNLAGLVNYINGHQTKHSSLASYQGKTYSPMLKIIETKDSAGNILPEALTLESIQPKKNLSSTSAQIQNIPVRISAKEKLQNKRLPELLASLGIFLILFSLGLRNMTIHAKSNNTFAYILGVETTESQIAQSTPSPIDTLIPTESSTPIPILDSSYVITTLSNETSTINIRKYPSSSTEKVGTAANGDIFEVLSKKSGWYEIKLLNGSSGFIPEEYAILKSKNI